MKKKSKPHAARVASQRNAGAVAASTKGLARTLGPGRGYKRSKQQKRDREYAS